MPSAEKYARGATRRRTQALRRSVKLKMEIEEEEAESTTKESYLVSTATSVVTDESRRQAAAKTESRLRSLRCSRLSSFKQHMKRTFFDNTLDCYCFVCERIWWSNMLRTIRQGSTEWRYVQSIGYDPSVDGFMVCGTCYKDLKARRTPQMSTVNGFRYPEEANLPQLCPISERLISPRLPFMCIRNIRFFEGARKMYGQVINVPVSVDNMVRVLPRRLDDDYSINIRIKRNLLNKSSYLVGCVSKSVIKEWLRFLVNTPLYQQHNITVSPEFRDALDGVPDPMTENPSHKSIISQIRRHCSVVSEQEQGRRRGEANRGTGELVMSQIQETMFWGEDFILEMAPGQNERPLALAFDGDAEELSFPTIYYGQPRRFAVPVTPYQMATSEIRRRDRRGVRSNHILYMAAKIMRLNMINSFNVMFRNREDVLDKNVTREQIESTDYLNETMQRNEAFMSCLPNSIQYWKRRKSDLFAMMRQLGKPTVFLTLSASEIHWLPLLKCLYRYRHNVPPDQPIDDVIFLEMTMTQKAMLANDDPILCCLYFNRLVDCIVSALKLKKGPFGKYRVLEYFRRIEFQHRGSPHCHMLLWLDNAPPIDEVKFTNGETLPETIALIDELCVVEANLVPSERRLQTHRHTHTCYKRNTKSCRFGAPFWPMKSTRVLLPVPEADRVESLVDRFRSLRERLCAIVSSDGCDYGTDELESAGGYHNIEDFWVDNDIENESEYLNIIRHGIHRPIILYKRSMCDLMVSPFNPTISAVLQSNMDIQYILDEYTCAAYVAEYVNKAERGISSLHRELVRLRDEFPEMDYEQCLKEVGKRILNNVEMCTQEAAWFLLRLPMSETSRVVTFIPTQHPRDRFKCKKSRQQMNNENLDGGSTDVWKKNIIEHYEERPAELDSETLADFVAWYDRVLTGRRVAMDNDDVIADHFGDEGGDDLVEAKPGVRSKYRRRSRSKIIKWVNYGVSDLLNYQREMVTLFWPFRSEELDVLNDDAYVAIYRNNEQTILNRRAKYQSGLRIDEIISTVVDQREAEDAAATRGEMPRDDDDNDIFRGKLTGDALTEMDRDIDSVKRATVVRAVKNAMSHADFCRMVRSLNREQRALLLEFMTRLVYGGEPLQIFFCGPAGSGKTYLLRALMETANRFSTRRNTTKCAYLACATTGKAAVNIDGTTVHTGLNIAITTREARAGLAFDKLQTMRCDLAEVCTIIIDEVSMMSSDMLNRVSDRLKACGKKCQDSFGGFHVVFCGDLRQLPPVNASVVYSRPKNMLQDAMIWQNLQYYNLKTVMRQADKQFSDILTKIGDGRQLNDQERQLLESRFIEVERVEECAELRSAVRLFHSNADVNDYNYRRLSSSPAGVIEVHAQDTIIGCANSQQRESALRKLYSKQATETGYLPRILYLSLDTPYMVTQNIDKNDRLVNGSTGVLKFIEYSTVATANVTGRGGDSGSDNTIVRLWFKFDDPLCGASLRLKYAQHSREYGIDSSLIPIVRRELPIKIQSKVIRARRKQFPVLPCNAQTIHKVQGASFDQVVYEYDRSHNISLVYVALSRARSLEGLFLTNRRRDHKFYHCRKDEESRRSFRDEMKRLETKRLITIVDTCDTFLATTREEREVSIAALNVQSMNAHTADVEADDALKNVSVLALSETWMKGNGGGIGCRDPRNECYNSTETCKFLYGGGFDQQQRLQRDNREDSPPPVAIKGFKCVARARRDSMSRVGGGGVAIYESLQSNFTACHRVDITKIASPHGDVCCAYMKYRDKNNVEQSFCLVAFYCRPGISADNLMVLVDEAMWRFSRAAMPLHTSRRGDLYWCPIIVCGDFNFNFAGSDGPGVTEYFRETYMLDYVSRGMGPSTRNGTTIDAVFVKRAPLELMYYSLYFSTHRGLIMRTKRGISSVAAIEMMEEEDPVEQENCVVASSSSPARKRKCYGLTTN